jgi:hypothetical protein
MPAALWAAAVALARQHGLYLMARALRVDYGALKKRMDAAGAGRGPSGCRRCCLPSPAIPNRRPRCGFWS